MHLAYLFGELTRNERGMAPHYLTLYAMVRGLEPKAVFEFGMGISTHVILDALQDNELDGLPRGQLYSVAPTLPDTAPEDQQGWTRFLCTSREVLYCGLPSLQFVLHDGSHDVETVADDLLAILPVVQQYGLVAVHDSQHSYSGEGVRSALAAVCSAFPGRLSHTTLPFGFGLTLLRVEQPSNPTMGTLTLTRRKRGSPHFTVPA